MRDFRKHACEISGILFKEVNRKGIRRDRLAKELGISENQIKNYAYDSTKSATLENFLQVLITYRCETVLSTIAREMGYGIYRLPDTQPNGCSRTEAAAEALLSAAKAVQSCIEKNSNSDGEIFAAIEKFITLDKITSIK